MSSSTAILNKSVLVPSVQGGPFGVNNTNKIINLELDAGATYDLTQSFVQLTVSITPNADITAPPGGIGPVTPSFNLKGIYPNLNLYNAKTPDLPVTNLDLIRNATLNSSKKGNLEQINRTNVLHENLKVYQTTLSERESVPASLYQTYSYDVNEKYSPFVEAHKQDAIPSTYVDARLRVPLSDLLEMGAISQFPCDDAHFGKSTIKLELEDTSRLKVFGSTGLGTGLMPLNEFDIKCENITVATNTVVQGNVYCLDTSNQVAPDSNNCVSNNNLPFVVGQNVLLTGQTLAGEVIGVFYVYTYITAIYKVNLGWSVNLANTFPTIALAGVTGYTNIHLKNVMPQLINGAYGSYTIKTVELGLVEVMSPEQPMQELEYTTFAIEEYSCDATDVLNKMFMLEPNCVNVFCLFNDIVNANLLSSNKDIEFYRMILNGEQVVDRDVLVNIVNKELLAPIMHSPLHYEMVRRLFRNSSIPIHSMLAVEFSTKEAKAMTERTDKPVNQCMLLGCPVNQSVNPTQFQLNISMKQDAKIHSVTLFKQLVKNIKF
jgi:hypothetical protein